MSSPDFESLFRQSLADHQLSRGEKKVLSQMVADAAPNVAQRGALRQLALKLATGELSDPSARAILEWLHDIWSLLAGEGAAQTPTASANPNAAVAKATSARFSPGDDCLNQLLDCFRAARRNADLCVFTITDDRISEGILAMHKRGVAVRLITDNDKANDLGSDIDQLGKAGIPVRMDRTEYHMHHKFAIFDGAVLVNGSYNWTRNAARFNQENIMVLHDPAMIAQFSKTFDRLWREFA